jgi:sec-independent protein translocase protein TatC
MKRTFTGHLKVLRNFLYTLSIFSVVLFLLIYIFFKTNLINLFIINLKNMGIDHLHYLNIYDGFLLPFKLTFYLWAFILLIIIITSFLLFIEAKLIYLYFLISLPLILYMNFTYLIPLSWKNFYNIIPVYGSYFITLQEILNFIFVINLCGFVIFYLPFLFIILYTYHIISEKIFNKIKKYWIFISVVVSGVIAPADILSHLIMSLLMVVIFNIFLIIPFFIKKFRKIKKEKGNF